jgi:hypothetical protein
MANGTPFTKQELEVVNNTALTHTEVAVQLGRSVNSVFSKRHQLGLIDKCKGHRRPWTKAELNAILNLDTPLDTLVSQLNRTRTGISTMRSELSKVA